MDSSGLDQPLWPSASMDDEGVFTTALAFLPRSSFIPQALPPGSLTDDQAASLKAFSEASWLQHMALQNCLFGGAPATNPLSASNPAAAVAAQAAAQAVVQTAAARQSMAAAAVAAAAAAAVASNQVSVAGGVGGAGLFNHLTLDATKGHVFSVGPSLVSKEHF